MAALHKLWQFDVEHNNKRALYQIWPFFSKNVGAEIAGNEISEALVFKIFRSRMPPYPLQISKQDQTFLAGYATG